MPSREKSLWARIFGPLIYLFKAKPKPVEAASSLASELCPQFVPISQAALPSTDKNTTSKHVKTKVPNPEFKLSVRLSNVAAINTPKALRKHRSTIRSTQARPAPVKRSQVTHKKRDIGPITWAAYKGRTSATSVKIAKSPQRSAQILRLHTKSHFSNQPKTCKRRNLSPKTMNNGFAHAA